MKLLQFYLSSGTVLLLFFFQTKTISAQTECYTTDPQIPQQTGSPNVCWENGIYQSTYDQQYIPLPTDEIKTVNIILHVMQRSDGSDNFSESIQADMDYLNALEPDINSLLANIPEPLYQGPTGESYITDSRIRVNIESIYFHQDDIGFTNQGENTGSYSFDNYGVETCRALNVFICDTWDPERTSVSGTGTGLWGENTNYLMMYNMYADYMNHPPGNPAPFGGRPWIVNPLILHELGHCLGLLHSSASCNQFPDLDCPQLTTWCNPTTDAQCSNNVMSRSSSKRHFTPLQLGHMHELLTTSWRKKMLKSCGSDLSQTNVISQDETWDVGRVSQGNIRIATGNKLTIKCLLSMPSGAKIMIEPGAECVIDGGRITNTCCDLSWEGIEVWGNSNLTQTPSNQGKLTMKNGATLENAQNAVTLWKPNDWNSTGGIIQATNSNFWNNKRSVEFMKYQNVQSNGYEAPNRSYFRNCHFKTDDNYILPSQGNIQMMTMYKVNGVKVQGCEFEYDRTVSTVEELESAIYTIDANFRVENYCAGPVVQIGQPCDPNDLISSTFTGFNRAVYATAGATIVGPEIKEAVFSENMVGIQFDATTGASATFNEFNVGNNPFVPLDPIDPSKHVGVYINNCDEYILEENVFTGDDIYGQNKHGIYLFSSEYNANSNTVFKNNFYNLTAGNVASGDHADPNTSNSFIGLRYVCNENQQNVNDFELRPNQVSLQPSEISNYQNGGPGIPAGNTFSQATSNDGIYAHIDFFSVANYEYLKNSADTDPLSDEIKVTPGSMTVTSSQNTNACLTHFTKPGKGVDKEDLLGKLGSNKEGFNNLYYSYLQLIDEGNTAGMIAEIDLTWPQNAWDLHANLMDRSPYNSEEVLIAAFDKNILTDGMMLEVLLANPDALRSGNVISHIQNAASPLPEYMIEILEAAAQSPQTVRSSMEKNLSDLHYGMVSNHKLLLHEMLNDSTEGFHPDTLMARYKNIKTLKGRYQQIFGYLGNGDHINALAIIDTIQLHYKLTNEQGLELATTEDFVQLIKGVHTSGRSLAQLTSSEISDLQDIADDDIGGAASERAENILCFFYDQCAQDGGAPKNNQPKRVRNESTVEELIANAQKMSVSPNPADHYVLFEYELLESSQEYMLRIIDVQGRVLDNWNLGTNNLGQKTVDTRSLPNGVYVFELIQNEKTIKSGKFMVQH